jgi:hypothetical protein
MTDILTINLPVRRWWPFLLVVALLIASIDYTLGIARQSERDEFRKQPIAGKDYVHAEKYGMVCTEPWFSRRLYQNNVKALNDAVAAAEAIGKRVELPACVVTLTQQIDLPENINVTAPINIMRSDVK